LADLRVRPGRSPKRRVILSRGPRYRDMKGSVRWDGIGPARARAPCRSGLAGDKPDPLRCLVAPIGDLKTRAQPFPARFAPLPLGA
jgi:hypothetical protein